MELAKHILVATDFSEPGRAAVEEALSLAEQLDARLSIVTVSQLRDAELPYLRSELTELEARLKPGGRLNTAKVYFGDTSQTILRAVEDLHADMIVLGSHSSHGFNRVGMGDTAEKVLREAQVPVYIVKRPPHSSVPALGV